MEDAPLSELVGHKSPVGPCGVVWLHCRGGTCIGAVGPEGSQLLGMWTLQWSTEVVFVVC